MGMAAILVMWPGPFEQPFVPPSHGDSVWNLASIGPVVSEEKMFKECGRIDDGRTTEADISYKLTNTERNPYKINKQIKMYDKRIVPQLGLDVGGNFNNHIWACSGDSIVRYRWTGNITVQ